MKIVIMVMKWMKMTISNGKCDNDNNGMCNNDNEKNSEMTTNDNGNDNEMTMA